MIAPSNSMPAAIAWDLANEYPASSLPGEGDAEFARRAAAASDGRICITPRCDAVMGHCSRAQFDALARGELVLADSFSGALADVHALLQLSSLPFLSADAADARRLFELARPHYAAVLRQHQHQLLFASPWPPTGLWTRQPLADAASLQGLRLRTYDRASAAVFAGLGADARSLSFAAAVPQLAAGELDAVLSSGDGGAGHKLWQYLPVFNPLGYAVPLSFTSMHLPAWQALDLESQRLIEDAAAATQQSQWLRMAGRVEDNVRRLRAHGASVAAPPDAPFRARLQAAIDGVIGVWLADAGSTGEALLTAYRGAEWVHSRLRSSTSLKTPQP